MLRSNNASEAWNARFNRVNNGQRQTFWRLVRQLRRYGTGTCIHPIALSQNKKMSAEITNLLGRRSGQGQKYRWPSWTSADPGGEHSGNWWRPRTRGKNQRLLHLSITEMVLLAKISTLRYGTTGSFLTKKTCL
jgi:hypothetical protein